MDMTYFNAEKTRDELVGWLRNWFVENGRGCKAVFGCSGGKDSTIAAALCCRAIGKENVLGVLMPNGEQKDIFDSIRVCTALGIDYINVNIERAYDSILDGIVHAFGDSEKMSGTHISQQTKINLSPRLRMSTLYAVSQTVNGRVINTSNRSEFVNGYFTRWGDECGDVKPLVNLTKTEVVEIGKTMKEIPIDLVEKPPADGLTGLTDEDKIGFSYDDLDKYIRDQTPINEEVAEKIFSKINASAFKRHPVDSFIPTFEERRFDGYVHIDEKDMKKFPEPIIIDTNYILHTKIECTWFEDAVVDGEPDDPDSPRIPGYHDGKIDWDIDIERGIILNWTPGTTANVWYKVCDQFSYDFQGFHYGPDYVPDFMAIDSDGWGDYVRLTIDKDGRIENWSKEKFLGENDELRDRELKDK